MIVLAVVRHACNLDYDKLQNLVEEHRSLRLIMGIGDRDKTTSFDWRRIQAALTAENKVELASTVGQVSLCPRHPKQYGEQLANKTDNRA